MATTRWPRLIALVALLLTMIGGAIGPAGRTLAATPDCGDGHKWDDAQQMCVDQQPSDCVDGQVWDDIQQMCVTSSTDGGSTNTNDQECTNGQVWDTTQQACMDPTPSGGSGGDQGGNAGAMGTASMAVSVVQCPTGYAFDGSGNPAVDCTQPLDGVAISWSVPGQQPVQQTTSGGGTTFTNLAAGSFTLAASAPAGATVAWSCQSDMGDPIAGHGASVAAQIADGEQASCTFFVAGAGISIVVHTFACPVGYDANGENANPVTDCAASQDEVRFTVSGQSTGVSSQGMTGESIPGTVTFGGLKPDTYTIMQASSPAVASAFVSQCVQSTLTNPSIPHYPTVTNGAIQYQFDQNDLKLECSWYIVPATAGTPTPGGQPTATGTPVVRQGVVAGQERGSIRIELSLCKLGFDPAAAPGADLSRECNTDYNFGLYPITFTAFGTTHDTATVGVTDSFFGWVKWDDNLGPDTYRVEATLPTGISTVLFEYCGETGKVENGKLTFMATVAAGGLFACGLDAVRDPAAPTPTRVPRADSSTLAIVSAVCPAGFVPGTTETDPNRACTGTTAGISYNLSGPAGSPNPVAVAGVDNLSIRATPGVYHIAFTMPETLASVAGARCTVYDIIESHWVDDAVLAPVTTGRDVAMDIDLPGAMLWTCTILVVPTGPSPTPTPSTTPTATITPTPTVTMTATTMPPPQSGTTSQPPAQSQAQAPSGTTSRPPTSTTGQNAIVIGTQATSTTAGASATPSGQLGIVIQAILCPVGTVAGGESACVMPYPGAVFTVQGATSGISQQATVGEILPDAAVFTELPPDTYTITQQRAAGIASTTGTCEVFARDAQGMATGVASAPVPVAQDAVQQVVDTTASVVVCTWYSLPDASFSALPTPASPQGVSLTVHAFSCPAGYDVANADANPTVDCLQPARGVAFDLAGAASGASTRQTTGADAAATDPKEGTSHSGTISFTGLVADSYTLTQAGGSGAVNAFASCALATATDAAMPIYPTVANGAISYQLNDNEALTCLWYIIPPAGEGVTPASPAQGGATDDSAPTRTPASSGMQGGATDDAPASDAATTTDTTAAAAPSNIYVFLYQCPAGYHWDANDPEAGLPCVEQPDGVAITIAAKASGTSSSQKTGDMVPGGVMITGVAADTYTFSVTLPAGTTIEARPCDVTGATDGSTKVPMQLSFSDTGSTFIALPADTTYSCNWYLVPTAQASAAPVHPGGAGDLRDRRRAGRVM